MPASGENMTGHTSWHRVVPLHQLQIVLFDENPAARAETRRALHSAGVMQIAEASFGDGRLTGARLKAPQLDVIISDIDLGAVNGLVLLKAIRLGRIRGLRPNMCFILLTGCTDPAAIAVAAALDANGYLMRPTTLDRLRSTVVKGVAKLFTPDAAKYQGVRVPALRGLPRRQDGDPSQTAARPATPSYSYARATGTQPSRDYGGPIRKPPPRVH